MECDLVYEDVEDFFFLFKNIYIEDVQLDKFSKLMLGALIRKQQDTQSIHYIDLCR